MGRGSNDDTRAGCQRSAQVGWRGRQTGEMRAYQMNSPMRRWVRDCFIKLMSCYEAIICSHMWLILIHTLLERKRGSDDVAYQHSSHLRFLGRLEKSPRATFMRVSSMMPLKCLIGGVDTMLFIIVLVLVLAYLFVAAFFLGPRLKRVLI